MDFNNYANKILVGTAVGAVSLAFVFFYLREPKLPGTVKKAGKFEVADVDDESKMEERRRDFLRCAKAKGILISVDGDLQPLHEKQVDDYDSARDILRDHLAAHSIKVEVEKIVQLLSVTPGFSFLMRHNIPPMTKQDKYLVIVGSSCVRVLWSSFITDEPKADQNSGPFVLNLLSENLVTKDALAKTTSFSYMVKPNKFSDMSHYLDTKRAFLAKAGKGEATVPMS